MLLAVFLQVGLTLWSIAATGLARNKALKTTNLKVADIALSKTPYPEFVQKQQNNMQNQFETPILLYAGAAIALNIGVNWLMAGAVLAYMATRFWHRWIHVRHNNVRQRFMVFTYGITALTVFWLVLAYRVFLA